MTVEQFPAPGTKPGKLSMVELVQQSLSQGQTSGATIELVTAAYPQATPESVVAAFEQVEARALAEYESAMADLKAAKAELAEAEAELLQATAKTDDGGDDDH